MRTWVALAAAAGLLGCGGGGSGGSPTTTTSVQGDAGSGFAAAVQPIFDSQCVRCHGAGGQGGLDLSAGKAYRNTVGVRSACASNTEIVAASNRYQSELYLKITYAPNLCGAFMPYDLAPLSDLAPDEAEAIGRWIDEGALDN